MVIWSIFISGLTYFEDLLFAVLNLDFIVGSIGLGSLLLLVLILVFFLYRSINQELTNDEIPFQKRSG